MHRTGPVYFVILYKLVLSSTPVSIRSVIRRMETMKLTDFEGENVKSAVSLIQGAVGLLNNNGAVPSDMIDIAFRIMKHCTTQEFSTHVTAMRTNHELGVKTMSLDGLLMNLQTKYNELVMNGEWDIGTAANNQQSIFTASYECHSCGRTDHFWRDCPNLNMERVATYMREFGYNPGRGRGGRGGRGRQTGRGAPRNVFRTPPGRGEAHVRRRGPLVERWCGTCGVWGSHASEQHAHAESAQVAAQEEQTQVSAITQPVTLSPVIVNDTAASPAPTAPQDDLSKHADDNYIPTLFLDFV